MSKSKTPSADRDSSATVASAVASSRAAKRKARSKPTATTTPAPAPPRPSTPEEWSAYWRDYATNAEMRAAYLATIKVQPLTQEEIDERAIETSAWVRLAHELNAEPWFRR